MNKLLLLFMFNSHLQITSFRAKTTTPMHSQGHGMIPHFILTCNFCGVDGHIRPNCFHYIKIGRAESMIKKKKGRANMHVPRKNRTNLHDPRTSRAHVPMTTRKENVSPRWIR